MREFRTHESFTKHVNSVLRGGVVVLAVVVKTVADMVKTVADMVKKKDVKGSKRRRNDSSTSDMERRLCIKYFANGPCDYSPNRAYANYHRHYIQLELKRVFGIMKF
ncbi:unnamed protein product [Brassica napus]|uniref:(rape) hypothetical protein n=1 Tax=Brassica napus TaxID=3708 RepID=A0A816J1Y8_BRANA|nr:unnamed protein product [Brassica napus]